MTSSVAEAKSGVPSARSLFKDILRGSGLYSLAFFAPHVASVILLPVMTRSLTSADYGVTDLLAQVGTVLNLLLGMNFAAALGYFYFAAPPGEARSRVISTAVLGSALIGAAAVCISWPFVGLLDRLVFPQIAAAGYLRLTIASLLPAFALEALAAWLRVENRPGLYVTVALARVLTTVGGIVLLVGVLQLRVWGVLWTGVAAVLGSLALLTVVWLRSSAPSFDARLFWRMAKYALPLGLGGIAMFVTNFGDRFILPHYRPFDDLGVYALGAKFGMMMTSLYASFQVYWGAQVFEIMRRGDADTVFPRILTYVILATSFCGLGLSVCAQPAVRILATPPYYRAASLVPIIAAAYFLRAIGDFLRSLLLVAGQPGRYAACNWIGAGACIGGFFLLAPRYGIQGAAVATLAAFGVVCACSAIWSYRAIPFRVEWKRLAKIGVAVAAGLLVNWLSDAKSLTEQIGSAAASIALFPMMLWLLRFPTAGEIGIGRGAIQTLIRTTASLAVRVCG